jgi:hypothetical protein
VTLGATTAATTGLAKYGTAAVTQFPAGRAPGASTARISAPGAAPATSAG